MIENSDNILRVLSYALATGVSLLVPIAANGIAIVVGVPITSVTRRIPGLPKSLVMDVLIVSMIGYILDGFLSAFAAYFFFYIFKVKFVANVLFFVGAAKVLYIVRKRDLAGPHSSNFLEGLFQIIMVVCGLVFSGMLLVR